MKLYADLLKARLAANITTASTSITLDDASSLPTLGGGEYFIVEIKQGATVERVVCTAVVGDVLTVTRDFYYPHAFKAGALCTVSIDPDGYTLATGGAVDSVNGSTGTVVLDADDISDTTTTHKFTTASDISKLAGIEASADVTDAGNVIPAISAATISTATVASTDLVIIKDVSDSNNTKTVTAQSIADLAGGGISDGDKGDITVTSSGTAWTIDNGAVTLAKQADMATASVVYRKTAGTGAPEVNSLATLKTDLGLTGTNSGDQTSIVGIIGTKAEFDTACSDGNFLYSGDVTQYTDEMAQDAVGAMVDSSLTYVDGTPLLQRAALTGDVTASAGSNATTIANDAVTYAKMQNVSATDKLLGRSSVGAGDVEEITCTAAGRALIDDVDASAQRTTLGLGTLATQSGTFSGTSSGTNTGDQTITLTGDVTGSGTGSFATTLTTPASATVATDDKVLIKDTSAADAFKYVTAQSIADLSGGGVSDGDKGDITVSSSGTVWTIDNDAVTYAKIQNVSATDKLLGRSTAGSGDVEEIACTAAGRALIDDADASAQRTTLGLGTLATQSGTFSGTSSGTNTGDQTITLTGDVTGSGTGSFAATIANDSVTYAKMQNVSATDKLLGRSTAGSGDVEEITCTSFARSVLDDADAATARTTLGAQPLDATLTALAAYNTNGLITQTAADTFTGRTITGTANQITVSNGDGVSGNPTLSIPYNFKLGSSATGPSSIDFNEDTDNGTNKITLIAPASIASDKTVTLQDITGTVYVTGGTDVAVADGGTGASDAATARTNLGLVIGTDVQAYDAELAAIAGLTSAANKFPYFTGSGTAALADISSAMRTFLTTSSSANFAALLTDESGTAGVVPFQTEDTWTPTITTATVGNLSVSYTTQTGTILTIGEFALLRCQINFTPTYTTASGEVRIEGMPVASSSSWTGLFQTQGVGFTFPAGSSYILPITNAGSTYFRMRGFGTAQADDSVTAATSMPSGTAQVWTFNFYMRV